MKTAIRIPFYFGILAKEMQLNFYCCQIDLKYKNKLTHRQVVDTLVKAKEEGEEK